MGGEVSAVDGGHVAGLQRLEAAGVVPVVEVAPEALEAEQRGQGGLQAVEGLEDAEPAEVARRDDGEQVEPDVGGRRAMGDGGLRILLEVVGREEGVVRPDEGLEEAPGPAGRRAEDLALREGEDLGRRRARGAAHPAGGQRGEGPGQGERRCDRGETARIRGARMRR